MLSGASQVQLIFQMRRIERSLRSTDLNLDFSLKTIRPLMNASRKTSPKQFFSKFLIPTSNSFYLFRIQTHLPLILLIKSSVLKPHNWMFSMKYISLRKACWMVTTFVCLLMDKPEPVIHLPNKTNSISTSVMCFVKICKLTLIVFALAAILFKISSQTF